LLLPLVAWRAAPGDQRVFSPRPRCLGKRSVRGNYLFKEHYRHYSLNNPN